MSDTQKQLAQFGAQLAELARVNQERWTTKRYACFGALQVVDNVVTFAWGVDGIERQRVDICKARDALNNLVLTCDDADVVKACLQALGLREPGEPQRPVAADAIHDLRLAIGKELGFGSEYVVDRRYAWIAKLG